MAVNSHSQRGATRVPKRLIVPPMTGGSEPGPAGDTGACGQSAYDLAATNGFPGTEMEWLASLVGPAGNDGAPGADGENGADGATGATGPAGPTGSQGAAGATGPQGDAGATGPAGAAGATGPQGATGPKGDTGNTGPQGVKGDTGTAGATGSTGATGPQGPIGLTGPQGNAGPQGVKGDTGDTGAQGSQGIQGPAGADGVRTATTAFGYSTGAGGTVSQATSKATAVTLNKLTGEITMNAAALAAATIVTFVLNNSLVAAGDMILVSHHSGGTIGSYLINGRVTGAGACSIAVRNTSAASLSEAVVIKFAVIKAVTG